MAFWPSGHSGDGNREREREGRTEERSLPRNKKREKQTRRSVPRRCGESLESESECDCCLRLGY